MKKLIFLICVSAIVSLTSCLSINRIERNCDKFAKICIRDKETVIEYRDTVIFRTDTVQIVLPRDTVKLTDTIRIVNNKAFLRPVHKTFGLVGVDAWVNFSVLNVRGYLTDSTMLYTEQDTVLLPGAVQIKTVTNTVTVKHVPGIYKVVFWLFWIIVLVVLAWAVLFKMKIKPYLL